MMRLALLVAVAVWATRRGNGARATIRDCAAIDAATASAGLSMQWARFFAAVATHESRCVATAVRTGHASIAAAQIAYARNASKLNRPAKEYLVGEMGPWQLMPANIMTAWPNERPAYRLLNVERSLEAAMEYAKRLMQSDGFDGTMGTLLVGWGAPRDMRSATRLKKWQTWLAANGYVDFTGERVS